MQGLGALTKELTACLRSGRASRPWQGRIATHGTLRGMLMISERSAETHDCAVPEHSKGDLVIGKDGERTIGTLVERSTRFVILLHLPYDRKVEHERDALEERITELPDAMRRLLTWDQGNEMSEHTGFTVGVGIPVHSGH